MTGKHALYKQYCDTRRTTKSTLYTWRKKSTATDSTASTQCVTRFLQPEASRQRDRAQASTSDIQHGTKTWIIARHSPRRLVHMKTYWRHINGAGNDTAARKRGSSACQSKNKPLHHCYTELCRQMPANFHESFTVTPSRKSVTLMSPSQPTRCHSTTTSIVCRLSDSQLGKRPGFLCHLV